MTKELVIRLYVGNEKIFGFKVSLEDGYVKTHQQAFLTFINSLANKLGLKCEVDEVIA